MNLSNLLIVFRNFIIIFMMTVFFMILHGVWPLYEQSSYKIIHFMVKPKAKIEVQDNGSIGEI